MDGLLQFNDIEKHEIHCAKRYLDYTENEFFRAFRDRNNQGSWEFNYAVLKTTQNAAQTIQHVERFFGGMDVAVPKFRSAPDGVSLLQARTALERFGYEVAGCTQMRMKLQAPPARALNVLSIPVRVLSTPPGIAERALIKEAANGQDYALPMTEKKVNGGAKLIVAYNASGVPVSMCLGEGYGSAFYLSDVYTPRPCRKQGCATAVLAGAIRYAKEEGYVTLFLDADDDGARHMYEKLGFRGAPHTTYWAFKGGLPDALKA